MLFLVYYLVIKILKTSKNEKAFEEPYPFSLQYANIKKGKRKLPVLVIDFLLKLQKYNVIAKQEHHCINP